MAGGSGDRHICKHARLQVSHGCSRIQAPAERRVGALPQQGGQRLRGEGRWEEGGAILKEASWAPGGARLSQRERPRALQGRRTGCTTRPSWPTHAPNHQPTTNMHPPTHPPTLPPACGTSCSGSPGPLAPRATGRRTPWRTGPPARWGRLVGRTPASVARDRRRRKAQACSCMCQSQGSTCVQLVLMGIAWRMGLDGIGRLPSRNVNWQAPGNSCAAAQAVRRWGLEVGPGRHPRAAQRAGAPQRGQQPVGQQAPSLPHCRRAASLPRPHALQAPPAGLTNQQRVAAVRQAPYRPASRPVLLGAVDPAVLSHRARGVLRKSNGAGECGGGRRVSAAQGWHAMARRPASQTTLRRAWPMASPPPATQQLQAPQGNLGSTIPTCWPQPTCARPSVSSHHRRELW